MKNIYKLKLNEQTIINKMLITKVHGGWIYIIGGNPIFIKGTFSPEYKEEFEITIDELLGIVSRHFNLPKDFLRTKSNGGKIPLSKQLICKIAKEELGLNQLEVSNLIGYSDRSTVSYSYRTVNDLLMYNNQVMKDYKAIMSEINTLTKKIK